MYIKVGVDLIEHTPADKLDPSLVYTQGRVANVDGHVLASDRRTAKPGLGITAVPRDQTIPNQGMTAWHVCSASKQL